MARLRLFGAAIVVGIGLDCAGAPRSEEVPGGVASSAAASASTSGDDEAPNAVDTRPTEAPAPATRYASLTNEACATELVVRRIPHEALPPRLGIAAPVRLRGKLSGVTFRTLWPDPERERRSFEIMDCRLVLALDDFSAILRAHAIDDVMFFSAYRAPPAGWIERGNPIGPHEAGLAIDIGYFGKSDRTALNVERDFHPRPPSERERICTGAPPSKGATPEAFELRRLACEAYSSRLFHVTLTPAYDVIHKDHFHLELTPDKTEIVGR